MTVAFKPSIAIGATALAGLAALGGVGAVLNRDAGSPTAATGFNVTEVATTTAPPDSNSNLARLMSLVPDGYDAKNCQVVDNPPRDSLATVDCDQNSLPNGPTSARFSLYPDVATLDAHFQTRPAKTRSSSARAALHHRARGITQAPQTHPPASWCAAPTRAHPT